MRNALLALVLLGCGAFPPPADPPPPGDDGPDGDARLDHAVVPLRYDLELTIDPALDRVGGVVRIDVRLEAEADELRLHARDLDIQAADVVIDGEEREATVVPGPNGGLGLRVAEPIPAGEATLRFVWEGPLPQVPEGLYRVRDGDDWYAFTQFEARYARQAFPCFDEPGFKVPFQVTLKVPNGQLALTNSLETHREEGETHTTFRFAETKPLPTYLVAFAVGPLDVVEAPTDAIPGVPLRLVATRGKGRLAAYALERTPVIHAALSRYFDRPHPFDKLDLVAVPNFAAGAMENVGLVTFRETLILLDGETAPADRKMWSQAIIAHELAHMWFGNLVTPTWWDDLWLNEAFATWMAQKVVQEVDPELEMSLTAVAGTAWVMSLDAQKHARAIRQPIKDGGDIDNAFDGITYGKGAAVLRMLEAWLGEDTFRDAVRAYMKAHEYGNGRTEDLMEAFEAASKKPVGEVARLFLDQPGTPLVRAEVVCDGEQPATLMLSQRRYLPAGSDAPQGDPWQVPVCARYAIGDAVHRECFVLDAPARERKLAHPGCPTWLHPNASQKGYYQWTVPAKALEALVETRRGELEMVERVALVGQLRSLVEAGALPVSRYLDALESLAKETHRLIVGGVVDSIAELHRTAVDGPLVAPFQAFVTKVLGPRVARVGLAPKEGEGVETRLLRPQLVGAYAYMSRDPALLKQARAEVDAFLADREAVAPEVAVLALPMVAWDGDEALWERLRDAAVAEKDPVTRVALVTALGAFEAPALRQKTLQLVIDGVLLAQDFRQLARGGGDAAARTATWDWLVAHYEPLVGVLGPSAAPRLPWLGGGFCSSEDRQRVADFFADPAHAPSGTERNLGLVLENIDRCARLRDAIRGPLAEWLGRGP